MHENENREDVKPAVVAATSSGATGPVERIIMAEIRADGVVVLEGRQLHPADGDARGLLLDRVTEMAAIAEAPLLVRARHPGGTRDLVAWPDGAVTPWNPPGHLEEPRTEDPNRPWYLTPPPAQPPPTPGPSSPSPDPSSPGPPSPGPPAPSPSASPSPGPPPPAPVRPHHPATDGRDPATVQRVRLATGSMAVLPVPTDGAGPTPAPVEPFDSASAKAAPPVPAGPLIVHPLPSQGLVLPPARRVTLARRTITRALATAAAIALVAAAAAAVTHHPGGTAPAALRAPTARAAHPSPATQLRLVLTAAPPGYATTPLWAAAVSGHARTAVTDDGTIVTQTPAGNLIRLDPVTGAVTWTTRQAWPTGWDGPALTSIDGQPAAVLTSTTRLLYWTLPAHAAAVPSDTPPRVVALPAGAHLVWTGTAPLVTTGTGDAAVVHDGALDPVALPAGYTPLAADTTGSVLAADTTAGRWLLAAAGATPTTQAIPAPDGAQLVRVVAVGTSWLLAVWSTSRGDDVMLLDTGTGHTVASGLLPADVDLSHAPITRLADGTTAVGNLLINRWINTLQLFRRDDQNLTGMAPGHLYATTPGGTVDVQVHNGSAPVVPLPASAPVPFAGYTARGHTAVTVLVPAGTAWALLALPTLTP